MAYDQDADLLVMGAYGHSRLREYVLGGVNRRHASRLRHPSLYIQIISELFNAGDVSMSGSNPPMHWHSPAKPKCRAISRFVFWLWLL